ncbi:hypothetical protein CEUSTIGMA_g1726.t1 [Chlamydomonas eustigma]|uniref:Protein-S-isoprenylcysteine O-methyltransferase n=1 Tax=Chlamydomonas eustigma TaxID=1157962 RepID=A0A250WTW8_9CHLO|nr:hypothetical protein CEUSTIGMA_g1726.t1 [Chlamydomonas eustigma]|eukprot:GAX74277.1 hypothetical protein CEUSTIGMA_g1726.t1 [Chlamydomonas eustigma]
MWWYFSSFLAAIVFFHVSEFILAAIYMWEELSWDSLLLSKNYCLALSMGCMEYCIECWLVPSLKASWTQPIAALGLFMVVVGESIRKLGMLTAKGAFTHKIRLQRLPNHVLVTSGIYRFTRHPGYLGWFVWSVGTQVLLVNPVSATLFFYTALKFFKRRIDFEESLLKEFFPEYNAYAMRTPTLIPFIR